MKRKNPDRQVPLNEIYKKNNRSIGPNFTIPSEEVVNFIQKEEDDILAA